MSKPFAASAVVVALELVWERLREIEPELPRAVIVVASGTEETATPRWGHWGASRWRVEDDSDVGEVLIAGEALERGAREVLGTLVHEAAHALAFVREIKDTSRGGRYHNARYKALAESFGLVVERHERYGWTVTRLSDESAELYVEELGAIAVAIGAAFRHGVPGKGKGGGSARSGSSRLLLECSCGRKFRISPAVAELGPITCGACGEDFEQR